MKTEIGEITLSKKKIRVKKTKPSQPSTAVKEYVKRAIKKKGENKEFLLIGDQANLTTLTPGTWVSDALFLPAQGTADGNRIGDKVTMKSIQCSQTVAFSGGEVLDATDPPNPISVRTLLVQLKRGFTIAELIAQLPTLSPCTPLKYDVLRMANILKDNVVHTDTNIGVISAATAATSQYVKMPQIRPMKFFAKPKIANIEWDSQSTGGVVPDIIGAVYLLHCSFLTGTTATNNYSANVLQTPDSRVVYSDA